MNEHIKQAALEAFVKANPGYNDLSDDELLESGDANEWLRACEWMHEYTTQAAYERMLEMAEKLYDEQGGLASGLIVRELRALAKASNNDATTIKDRSESAGKGEKG